jgi:hypothetical protein
MPVDQQRRHAPDDQQQRQQDEQTERAVQDSGHVDRHSGRDEEDRDEDPVSDGVELPLQVLGVQVEPPGPDPQHDPGQHRPEHHVEPEPVGERQQHEQQHHRPAQGDLRGRVLAFLDDAARRGALGQPRHQRQDDGEDPDQDDRDQRDEAAPLTQEHRDDQDREQFADRARGEHVATELAAEHPVIAQDGQQRAQRGGGQRQPNRHVVLDVADRVQEPRHPDRDRGRQHPADDRQPSRPLSQQVRVELVAGQQEQEPEPHVGQQLDVLRLGDAEDVRSDQDAADQEDDDLRDLRPRQQCDQERRERGDQRDRDQVVQPLQNVHDGRPAARDLDDIRTPER